MTGQRPLMQRKLWWPKSLRLRSRVTPNEWIQLLSAAKGVADAHTLAFLRDLAAMPAPRRMTLALNTVLRKLADKDLIVDDTDLLTAKEQRIWFDLVRFGLGMEERGILWRAFCVDERLMSHKFYFELFAALHFEIGNLYPEEIEPFMED